MKVIKIENCDQCPHCSFYDSWNGHNDVIVCEHREVIIQNEDIIDNGCNLEDIK